METDRPSCRECRRFVPVAPGAAYCDRPGTLYRMTMTPDVCGQFKKREEINQHESFEKGAGRFLSDR